MYVGYITMMIVPFTKSKAREAHFLMVAIMIEWETSRMGLFSQEVLLQQGQNEDRAFVCHVDQISILRCFVSKDHLQKASNESTVVDENSMHSTFLARVIVTYFTYFYNMHIFEVSSITQL